MIDPLVILSLCVAVWLAIMIFIESWRCSPWIFTISSGGRCSRHYLFLVEECCIGDGMDIFELLAIMCGMMLGVVAIIIIIGLVMGSIKCTHTKCYCWWLLLQLLSLIFIEGLKDEGSRLLLHDYSDCHRCGAFKCQLNRRGLKMKWLDFFFLIVAIVLTMTALTQ